MKPILYTFPISHFSEKARFGLDLANFSYELKPLVPGQHVQTLKPLVKDTYVPVLDNGGNIIQGSKAILDLVEEKAFGNKATDSEIIWEDRIDTEIGKSLQTILYFYILDYPNIVGKLFLLKPKTKSDEVPPPEHFELIALSLKRRYKINPKSVDAVKEGFRSTVYEIQDIYKKQKYFNGNNFGRIDLTVASLLGAFAEPKECPAYPWFDSVEMPMQYLEYRNGLGLEFLFERIREFYKEFRIQSK